MPRRGSDVVWGDDSGISDVAFDEPPVSDEAVEEGSLFSGEGSEPSLRGDSDGGTDETPPGHPDEQRPHRTTGPRKPVTDLFMFAWGSTGTLLAQTGIDPAVGRVMQFQAPIVGAKVDALVEGTFVDRILQPLADKAETAESTFGVLALPIVIGLFERNPTNPILGALAYKCVEANITELMPVLKQKKSEEKKNTKLLNEFCEEFEIPSDTDPVQYVLMQLLGPPQPAEEYVEETEPV